ncbi:ABC transporter permease [Kineococcus sp. SYSU DK005]|uniref:ABC transporter permease n=1 Tax=Kineococcus sp. SYSU DK005 TaxID=3383126 RepID=UPI003D7C6292
MSAAVQRPVDRSVQGQWWLVADREIRERLRDKGFVFSTVLLLVIVVVAAFLPGLLSGGTDRYAVAATGATAPLLAERPGEAGDVEVSVRTVADAAAAEAAVRAGDADAAVLPAAGGGVEVVGDRNVPDGLTQVLTARVLAAESLALLGAAGLDAATAERALAPPPPVQRLLAPDAVDPLTTRLLGLAFSILFLQIVVIFGYSIAQSVVQEKQTRVVELLVTTVPVRQLLVGKIVGNGLLALGQILILVAAGLGGLAVADRELLRSLPSVPSAAVWFVVFFVVGFAMLSCLWAAAGAMANRLEDLQSTATPVQMLVMLPFFATFAANDPGTLQSVLSYVPLSSPMVMPKRVLQGDVGWLEPLLALAVIAATAAVFVAVARRLYENSLLQTGRSLSLRSAWRRAA